MNCYGCGEPITTVHCLVFQESHVPQGQRGCEISFKFMATEEAEQRGRAAFGGMGCATSHFNIWMIKHTTPEGQVAHS
jgi:hypothetical protein